MPDRFDFPRAAVTGPDDDAARTMRQASEHQPDQNDPPRPGEGSEPAAAGEGAPAPAQPGSAAPHYRRSLFRR